MRVEKSTRPFFFFFFKLENDCFPGSIFFFFFQDDLTLRSLLRFSALSELPDP